jgi:hypothetical protein
MEFGFLCDPCEAAKPFYTAIINSMARVKIVKTQPENQQEYDG